jgi:hypothetical protein
MGSIFAPWSTGNQKQHPPAWGREILIYHSCSKFNLMFFKSMSIFPYKILFQHRIDGFKRLKIHCWLI